MNQPVDIPARLLGHIQNELRDVEAKLALKPHPSIAIDYQKIKMELEDYTTFLSQMINELSKLQPLNTLPK